MRYRRATSLLVDRVLMISRRNLLRSAATISGALIVGFDSGARYWISNASAGQQLSEELPKIDGVLQFDDSSLEAVATDLGNFVHHRPAAVLKPGSVLDIVRMVEYANQHRLKIAMR